MATLSRESAAWNLRISPGLLTPHTWSRRLPHTLLSTFYWDSESILMIWIRFWVTAMWLTGNLCNMCWGWLRGSLGSPCLETFFRISICNKKISFVKKRGFETFESLYQQSCGVTGRRQTLQKVIKKGITTGQCIEFLSAQPQSHGDIKASFIVRKLGCILPVSYCTLLNLLSLSGKNKTTSVLAP